MVADSSPSFGTLLQRYRRLAGLSQEDLAEQAHVSVRSISNLERGLNHPHNKTLTLLADALRLNAEDRQEFVSAAHPAEYSQPAIEVIATLAKFPQPLTRLIGREQEVDAVTHAILQKNARLVTLTGMAGIGKTRLALGVAMQLQPHFPDGVVFVPLASLRDWRLIPSSVAQAIRIQEEKQQSLWDIISASLAPKTTLLVLDNLEHLLEGAAFVVDLLMACPSLVIIVTSRSALRVRGERLFLVPPLHVASDPAFATSTGSAAEALFVERAREVRPGFQLTAENAVSITAICRRLEGIPLAIELASMRVTALSPQEISQHLDHRLSLLVYGPRDLPQRQQTMRDAVAWSYDMLSPPQQALFRRLSVFVGGWTLSAAHAVCGADTEDDAFLTTLSALVENNLIHHWPEEDAEDSRFLMLAILREYGLEQLVARGELGDQLRRHAEYMMKLAQEAEPALRGPEQGQWLRKLDDEQDNLRAALQWAKEHDTQLGLSIAISVWRFWYMHHHLNEGRSWLEQFATQTQGQSALRQQSAQASYAASVLAREQGAFEQSKHLAETSYALFQEIGDVAGMCSVLTMQGSLAAWRDQYQQSEEYYRQAFALGRQLGDDLKLTTILNGLAFSATAQGHYAEAQAFLEEGLIYVRTQKHQQGIATCLINLSNLLYKQGQFSQAIAAAEESLLYARSIGDRALIAAASDNLGKSAMGEGDYQRAIEALQQSQRIFVELQDHPGTSSVLRHLGDVAREQGNWQLSEAYYLKAVTLNQQAGTPLGTAKCLANLAQVLSKRGLATQATCCASKAMAIFEEIGIIPQPGIVVKMEQLKRALQETIGEDTFQAAWERGKTLTIEELLPSN